MNGEVELRPGLMPLADWRSIYRGAEISLDPVARVDVEAGKAALSAILARNDNIAPADISNGSPSVAELMERRGEPLPHGLLRLFVALKLASLGQGLSGMRWSVIKSMAEFLTHDLLPVVPAEEPSDRLALSRLFGALTGTGEILRRGRVRPAQKALQEAGIKPLMLNPRERRALLAGTELSVATALAGLFEAERVLQSAIVAAALTTAAKAGDPFLHTTVHRLYRQRGQIDVAAAFRTLLGLERQDGIESTGHTGVAVSHEAHRMGVCLDVLRQAGATLERAANSVTEDQLVLWQSEEIVASVEDLSSVAVASDLIALGLSALCELCEKRIALAASGGAANAADAAAHGDIRSLGAKAASFVAENRERAQPTGLDPAGLSRLLPMAGTTALVVAIEFLEAARRGGQSEAVADRLGEVRRLVLEAAPPARETGAIVAGNLASIAVIVGSGALAAAPGVDLPAVAPRQPERTAFRLGGRAKRT